MRTTGGVANVGRRQARPLTIAITVALALILLSPVRADIPDRNSAQGCLPSDDGKGCTWSTDFGVVLQPTRCTPNCSLTRAGTGSYQGVGPANEDADLVWSGMRADFTGKSISRLKTEINVDVVVKEAVGRAVIGRAAIQSYDGSCLADSGEIVLDKGRSKITLEASSGKCAALNSSLYLTFFTRLKASSSAAAFLVAFKIKSVTLSWS